MQNLDSTIEQSILEGLKTKLETIDGMENVIIDDEEFSSKRDGLEAFTAKDSDNDRRVKYCYLSLDRFEDSKTDGCDDMPVVFLYYTAHLVEGYKEKRKNSSTPKADFKKLYLDIRNKFLEFDRSIQNIPNCETSPVIPKTSILLDDDPLTGVYSYFVDLEFKVTVW